MMSVMQGRFIIFLCMTLLLFGACQPPNSQTVNQQNQAQSRLISPLIQALDAALAYSHGSRSPDEAELKAKERFFSEIKRLLVQPLNSKNVQIQIQAQLTPQGQIQIQAQAQISDQNITAQAQRQSLFAPGS